MTKVCSPHITSRTIINTPMKWIGMSFIPGFHALDRRLADERGLGKVIVVEGDITVQGLLQIQGRIEVMGFEDIGGPLKRSTIPLV